MRKMYFIGVTTAQSSIQRVFPEWARLAGVEDALLTGIDIPVDSPPSRYRAAVETVRNDPDAWGALVTSHKIGVYDSAGDLFTGFDANARALGEVSCMVRRGHRLTGHALDPLAGGLALDGIFEAPFRGHVCILGAGGAALALAVQLLRAHRPAAITLTDTSSARLERARHLSGVKLARVEAPAANDSEIARLPPGSLVVNATGLGKDRPGSPLTPRALFPTNAIAWDLNYRGNLLFLDAARVQGIRAVDGWEYFLHGWSQTMAQVFGFELAPELFAAFRAAASLLR
ncbi:MAG: shikimate dehydrogenase [Bryobacteraceae bacterium]